jgi:hypothetical protein
MMISFKGIVRFATLAAVAAGCGGSSSIGGLDAEHIYTLTLSQSEEVPPPTPTNAAGAALIVVYPDSVSYQVAAAQMVQITMAHIHSGAPGVAGPIVVTLFAPATPLATSNGVFTHGTITQSTLGGSMTLADFKTLLASGNAYVNVHTTINPNGEIRGQIK